MSQLAATAVPRPDAEVTSVPSSDRSTVTVQLRVEESRADRLIGPPQVPVSTGAYSLGRPLAATLRAMVGSCAIEPRPRARRQAGVPVTGDRAEEHRHPGLEPLVPCRHRVEGGEGIDVPEIEPPRQRPHERVDRLRGRVDGREVPEHGDAERARVEPLRMRTDDVLVDPAVAALVDRPEAVDERVVADVVPAVRLDVVGHDPPHDGRRLLSRVGVRPGSVVDDGEPELRGDLRVPLPQLLVRLPGGPRHDRRSTGSCGRPERQARDPAPDRERADAGHLSAPAHLEPGRSARPRPGRRSASRSGPTLRSRGHPGAASASTRSHGPNPPRRPKLTRISTDAGPAPVDARRGRSPLAGRRTTGCARARTRDRTREPSSGRRAH